MQMLRCHQKANHRLKRRFCGFVIYGIVDFQSSCISLICVGKNVIIGLRIESYLFVQMPKLYPLVVPLFCPLVSLDMVTTS